MNLEAAFSLHSPRLVLPSAYQGSARADVPFPAAGFELNLATGLWFSAVIDPTAAAAVSTGTVEADDEVVTLTSHGFQTGDPLVLTAITGGTGLTQGNTYYAIRTGANTLKLATSLANAQAGTAVNVTVDGTGITLTPANAVSAFDPAAWTVQGGAFVGVAEGSSFERTIAGLHYLLVQEEVIDPAVATVDHTFAVQHVGSTNAVSNIGLSSHENAGPWCACAELKAPKLLTALPFGGGEYLRFLLSDVTNVRLRVFGIGAA